MDVDGETPEHATAKLGETHREFVAKHFKLTDTPKIWVFMNVF